MKKVIISPYARALRNGQANAKNYPFWKELIDALHAIDVHTYQIGLPGEMSLNCKQDMIGLSFQEIGQLVDHVDGWISVDNFFPHFVNYYNKKPGVVIWGKSDPNIFGYKQNVNILKDVKYLRHDQYNIWDSEPYDIEAFINPETIFHNVIELIENVSVMALSLDP
jgi:ADP-heptose:LPS heptosyltransferase